MKFPAEIIGALKPPKISFGSRPQSAARSKAQVVHRIQAPGARTAPSLSVVDQKAMGGKNHATGLVLGRRKTLRVTADVIVRIDLDDRQSNRSACGGDDRRPHKE